MRAIRPRIGHIASDWLESLSNSVVIYPITRRMSSWLFRTEFDIPFLESRVGTKKTGKGRRKIGRKKRRNRAKIRHRKK